MQQKSKTDIISFYQWMMSVFSVSITSPALDLLLYRGIDVIYQSNWGKVSTLLNLGYSFFCNEVTTCLIAKRFDLEIGFLHSIHYGRNSLALDIMEEFRAAFIDEWILYLLNRNWLKREHFNIENGDWRLTETGFRKFCELYHEHVLDWKEIFREQANKFKTALIKGELYEPYRK